MSFYMSFYKKSLFSTKTLNNNFSSSFNSNSKFNFNYNYKNYKRPQNHLNVSDFIEKFKLLEIDKKEEKVSLTGKKGADNFLKFVFYPF
jgi:hypothetical protein